MDNPNALAVVHVNPLCAAGMLTQRAQSRAFAVADTSYVLTLAFRRLPIGALIGFLIFDEVPEIWV